MDAEILYANLYREGKQLQAFFSAYHFPLSSKSTQAAILDHLPSKSTNIIIL